MADLERFHAAQEGVIDRAIAELRAGAKTSHWMWFVFPQIAGLGRSAMARQYAIADLAEAQSYLADPVLRDRLTEAARAMLLNAGIPPESVLGGIDAAKLRSSATLFEAAGGGPEFTQILAKFYENQRCEQTLATIRAELGG